MSIKYCYHAKIRKYFMFYLLYGTCMAIYTVFILFAKSHSQTEECVVLHNDASHVLSWYCQHKSKI